MLKISSASNNPPWWRIFFPYRLLLIYWRAERWQRHHGSWWGFLRNLICSETRCNPHVTIVHSPRPVSLIFIVNTKGNLNDSVPEWNMEDDSFPRRCRSNPAASWCVTALTVCYCTVFDGCLGDPRRGYCQPVSQLSFVLRLRAQCWFCERRFKMKSLLFGEKSARHVLIDKDLLYFRGISKEYARCSGLEKSSSHWLSAGRQVLILRLQKSPLKTSTVLSAINIAVLNFWMSDEGIEADPDESMNEWWWVDWKSHRSEGDRWKQRASTFFNLCFQEESQLWHLADWDKRGTSVTWYAG